jgi:hypothetical protein
MIDYKKERAKLLTKTRSFGFRVQKQNGQIYFGHKETGDEHRVSDDFENIRAFVKQAERDYKLKQLGL